MSVFSQMHFIERMPPDQQRRLQLRQIERVVRHAHATVPFYRDKLDGLDRIPEGQLDEAFFSRIPIVVRSDIQDNPEAFLSNRIPSGHGKVVQVRTSGSTGKPLSIFTTSLTKLMVLAFSTRAQYWHNLPIHKKNVDIRSVKEDGTTPLQYKWSIMPWSGPCQRLDVTLPINQLFRQFIEANPSSVLSHPYTLMLLAETSRETGIYPRDLTIAMSFGEAVSPRIRDTLREIWNVPVIDSYSSIEIGIMAFQCPANESLHVQVENVRLEVLDEEDNPCKPGDIGRIVLTNLQNFATPLIRYEIGDYAEVGSGCSCGRTLPVLTRILGRHRNLVVLKNGERFFPEIQKSLQPFTTIRQFQAHQRTYEAIDLRVVVSRPLSGEERKAIQATLQEKLRYPFNINVIEVNDIPRSASGKFEEFQSDIPGAEIDR